MKLFVQEDKFVLDFEGEQVQVELPEHVSASEALAHLGEVRNGRFLFDEKGPGLVTRV
jgi:hypothetical protein